MARAFQPKGRIFSLPLTLLALILISCHATEKSQPPSRLEEGTPQPFPPPPAPLAGRPDVVLITLDALRADHLPCYGYERNTAPILCSLARSSAVFEQAYAHSSETGTSVPALLTGTFPPGAIWEVIPPGQGIAARLRAAGYRTGAFLGNAWLNQTRGYSDGFSRFDRIEYVYPSPGQHAVERVDGHNLIAKALEFIRQDDSPTFLWLHLMDTHNPFKPPPPFLGRFGEVTPRPDRHVNGPLPLGFTEADRLQLIDRYDESISYTDSILRDLWLELFRTRRPRGVLLLVTADHGESLGEHDTLGHGTALSREELHVPLILHLPNGRGAGKRIARSVALWDVTPTLAGALELPAIGGARLDGRDLRGLLEVPLADSSTDTDRLLVAALRSPLDGQTRWRGTMGPLTLLFNPGNEQSILGWEGGERFPPARQAVLERALRAHFEVRPTRDVPPPMREDESRQLEFLGYIRPSGKIEEAHSDKSR